jgi:hypothetical protein
MISLYFSWVREREIIDSQEYISIYDTKALDLPVRDQFSSIAAFIEESSSGDYIEYYATYGGNIIENYILDLNNSGYDFILLHDLIISEYVYDPTSSSYNWVKTDELQTSQTDEYDKANFYRPIIKNTNAIAFKIDYTMRMYNRQDNTQVWKTASMISQSASKYGRKLRSINLGANPIQTKIYNQNVVKDIQINRISEPVLNVTKYITSFSTNSSISITTETVNPTENTNTSDSTLIQGPSTLQNSGTSNQQIFSNGLARVLIPESVCFLKFTLFQKVNGQNTAMNLSGIGDLYIVFDSDQGENLEFIEFPTEYINKGSGEVVFRLSENETRRILGLSNRSFRIFLQNDSGDRTFLYSGDFYSTAEFQEIQKANKVADLENQVSALTTQITSLSDLINQQKTLIDGLNQQNTQLQSTINSQTQMQSTVTADTTVQEVVSTAQTQLEQKDQVISQLNSTIESLNAQVSSLTASLQTITDQLTNYNGVPASTQNQTPSTTTTSTPSQTATETKLVEKVRANIKTDIASSQTIKKLK